MFRTATLLSKRRSLALSVHFKQPSLGMEDYEILSRASAFLVWVDPPETKKFQGKYADLEKAVEEREHRHRMQEYVAEPAGGPRRNANELGWLEFCPNVFRPRVHCFASSHVLAPWLWPNYYTQDWLKDVKQEHCKYSLEVYDEEKSLATFELAPYVIHHPTQLDLAMIHLKDEQESIHLMEKLNVQIFYMRDNETHFEKDDEVTFDGFWITEADDEEKKEETDEDIRIFHPFEEPGKLMFASPERFLASTTRPLPEGMCGGPAIDKSGLVAGIVEGIVPIQHEDKKIAGAASMLPSPIIKDFIEYAEQIILQRIVPHDVYEQVIQLKEVNSISHEKDEINVDKEFDIQAKIDDAMSSIKKQYSTDEIKAIQSTIQREQQEVMEIIEKEGGDLDDIIQRVKAKTQETQKAIFEFMEKEKDNLNSMSKEEVRKRIDEIIIKCGGKTTEQREKEFERKRPLVMKSDFDD